MQDNNITHRFYVPLGCTFSWVLGICLGGDFFDLFGHKNISLANNPHMLLFYSAKLLQKSEMRKDIVIELSYKGFS